MTAVSPEKIEGQGITSCLLSRHGISVFSEGQIGEAAMRLSELEARWLYNPLVGRDLAHGINIIQR